MLIFYLAAIGLRLFEAGAKIQPLESSELLVLTRPYVPPPSPMLHSAGGCVGECVLYGVVLCVCMIEDVSA